MRARERMRRRSVVIRLLACGLAAAALCSSPARAQPLTTAVASLSMSRFEHLPVGASASFTVTVTNTGGASLQLAEPTLPDGVYRGNNFCAAPLLPPS